MDRVRTGPSRLCISNYRTNQKHELHLHLQSHWAAMPAPSRVPDLDIFSFTWKDIGLICPGFETSLPIVELTLYRGNP